MASVLRDQLRTYHDPFAMVTNDPKIPDGSVSTSLGTRHGDVKEIAVAGSTMDMVLYAGQNSGLVIVCDEHVRERP